MTATDALVRLTNLVPDPQDKRDFVYEWDPKALLPTVVDLLDYCSTIEDQEGIGACGPNMLVGAEEMFLDANGAFVDLSRRFSYKTTRDDMGVPYSATDSGVSLRQLLRTAAHTGICLESLWPYDSSLAHFNDVPSPEAYADALTRKLGDYFRLQTWNSGPTNPIGQVRHALAEGYPVLYGLNVGQRLRTLQPGEVYGFTNKTSNPSIGGHAVLIVGYDDTTYPKTFKLRNSWGVKWGDHGYFRMNQAVVDVDTIDIWVAKGFAGFDRVGADMRGTATSMNAQKVINVYRQFFGRDPDAAGLAYWTAQLDAGMDELTFRRKAAWSLEFLTGHWDEVMSLYIRTEAFKSKYGAA